MQKTSKQRNAPGLVRDAIFDAFRASGGELSLTQIHQEVVKRLGDVPKSSVRSYLQLNTPAKFKKVRRGCYALASVASTEYPEIEDNISVVAEPSLAEALPVFHALAEPFRHGRAKLYYGDVFEWLEEQPDCSLHAVVTDPPYGIKEYTAPELAKLRAGRGGVWRLPPSFDGNRRAPLPRFTVLNRENLAGLDDFFHRWARALLPKLVPGANVVVASNPLLASIVSEALARAGMERRGELVRLTMTMRGGDRPKNAEREFSGVSVMPRSMWEPWLLFRRPLEGRVQDNLRKWGTGGFRRIGPDKPFGDVIKSAPTHKSERALANHPSLKPQAFLRQIVRAVLPLGEGVVADTFAGSGSTLAAAEAVGYASVGVERDETYWKLACEAIPKLARMKLKDETPEASTPPARRVKLPGADTASLPLVF